MLADVHSAELTIVRRVTLVDGGSLTHVAAPEAGMGRLIGEPRFGRLAQIRSVAMASQSGCVRHECGIFRFPRVAGAAIHPVASSGVVGQDGRLDGL